MHTLEELLLELCLGDLNLDRFIDLLLMSTAVVGVVLDGSREQRIDECCLAQARFTGNL